MSVVFSSLIVFVFAIDFLQVLEPSFRAPYVHVNRWFLTCINQPQFKVVLGEVTLCEKMATFDGKHFNPALRLCFDLI